MINNNSNNKIIISVENTGTEWNIFTDMNIEISDWLKECEINIASLHVEGATISVIKKEVKVYEKLQVQSLIFKKLIIYFILYFIYIYVICIIII